MGFLTYVFCGAVVYCANILMQEKEDQPEEFEKKRDAINHLLNDITYRFSDKNNYYKILRVTKKSSPSEIKQAFETALQIYNIDTFTHLFGNRNNINKKVNVFVNCIHNAYAILGNKTNKYYYDNKDIINNNTEPDDMINQFIDGFGDGFVDDFDPNDKASYWSPEELNN